MGVLGRVAKKKKTTTRKRWAQGILRFRTWGGKRANAGRRPRGFRASERHGHRPRHRRWHPVLVTMRVAPDIVTMRRRDLRLAIHRATISQLRRDEFRIVHLSIQATHLHALVEAEDAAALAKGMQGFQVSAAKHVNRVLDRRGAVFPDRYHAVALTTPKQVRHALGYVLNNWRRHGEDRFSGLRLDPYSTADVFAHWADDHSPTLAPGRYLYVKLPRTWLLRVGWRRHGAPSPWQRPGPAPGPAPALS